MVEGFILGKKTQSAQLNYFNLKRQKLEKVQIYRCLEGERTAFKATVELQLHKKLLQNKEKFCIVHPAHSVALVEGQIFNRDLRELSNATEIGKPLISLNSRAAAGPRGSFLLFALFFLVNFIKRQGHLISFPL